MSTGKSPAGRSREVRLGLVMYGGVSLAVYENGVAHELFNAVKGEGVYALVKALTDSDIVVDILSGTSAGGVNGVYLAYALANGKDFRTMADLWRKDGDLLKLMRSTSDPNTSSLLDSEGFYQPRLEQAFRSLPDYQRPQANWPYESPVEELDLFVTGTDADGDIYTVFDDQGHAIDVKNHRAVFQLCYRELRKNDFEDSAGPECSVQALAKLCRITSCFPVAFAPVHVRNVSADTDGLLQRWGKLGREAYFLDGGVLNNKPFSSTIDAIYGRTAECDTERMLFYVEPDPERFERPGELEAPNVLQSAVKGAAKIPGYQSIAADLGAIADRNRKLADREILLRCACGGASVTEQALEETQAQALLRLEKERPEDFCAYAGARLAQVRNHVVDAILDDNSKRSLMGPAEQRAARLLVESFQEWQGEGIETLTEFDVYFRIRRLYHVIYELRRRLYKAPEPERVAPDRKGLYEEVRHRLNHVLKLMEILRFSMETLIERAPIDWRSLEPRSPAMGTSHRHWADELAGLSDEAPPSRPSGEGRQATSKIATEKWASVQQAMRALLAADGISLPAPDPGGPSSEEKLAREAFAQAMKARIATVLDTFGKPSIGISGSLLAESEKLERAAVALLDGPGSDPVLAGYCSFVEIDARLFPAELVSGIRARDVIHTVRLSPVDAQRGFSERSIADKICGDKLGHFGSFLKRSWRSNDLLWGRLDALCQILECTLTYARARRAGPGNPAFTDPRLDLAALFPHQTGDRIDVLRKALTRIQSLSQREFDLLLTGLIETAQAEILHAELPRVIQDAIEQQVEWNQYRVTDAPATSLFLPGTQSWRTGRATLDPLLTSVTAGAVAGTEPDGGWEHFFRTQYRVGSEDLADAVPVPVLMELASTAALVLKGCIGAAAGKRAEALRANPALKLLELPLRLLHAGVRFQRRAPEFSRIVQGAMLTSSVALLTVAWFWRQSLLFPGGSVSTPGFAVFVILPAALLLAQAALIDRVRYRNGITLASLAGAAVFAAALVSAATAVLLGQAGYLHAEDIRRFLEGWPLPASVGLWLADLARSGPAFWTGALLAFAASMIGWFKAKRRLPKPPARRQLERLMGEFFSSEDLSRVALVLSFGAGKPPLGEKARLAFIESIARHVPVPDLIQAIREIKPGVLNN